jgi:D-tyrosyl-tRNA(Tyr) deacylase
MIALLQRVSSAQVEVAGNRVAAIDRGILALVGVQKGDNERRADRLLERILGYRVFADTSERMNLSLRDIHGGLLLVPQFTLAADTRKGTRASFTSAAPPQEGHRLFDYLVLRAGDDHPQVQCGRFGADMRVTLANEGPVTFWLET